VTCKNCASQNLGQFPGELTLCFDSLQTTLNNADPVTIIPRVLVCLDCGFSELVIPRAEVLLLKHGETSWTPGVALENCHPRSALPTGTTSCHLFQGR
jgi:hypothetical protein